MFHSTVEEQIDRVTYGCIECGEIHEPHMDRSGCEFCRKMGNPTRDEWDLQYHSRVDGHVYRRPDIPEIAKRFIDHLMAKPRA